MTVPLHAALNWTSWLCALLESSVSNENLPRLTPRMSNRKKVVCMFLLLLLPGQRDRPWQKAFGLLGETEKNTEIVGDCEDLPFRKKCVESLNSNLHEKPKLLRCFTNVLENYMRMPCLLICQEQCTSGNNINKLFCRLSDPFLIHHG